MGGNIAGSCERFTWKSAYVSIRERRIGEENIGIEGRLLRFREGRIWAVGTWVRSFSSSFRMNLIQLPFGPHNFLPLFFFFPLTVLLLCLCNCVAKSTVYVVVCVMYVSTKYEREVVFIFLWINKMESTFGLKSCSKVYINMFVVGFGR